MPSHSTLYRTSRSIGPDTLDALWEALAEVRAKVWRRAAATAAAIVVLDISPVLAWSRPHISAGPGPPEGVLLTALGETAVVGADQTIRGWHLESMGIP